MSDQRYDREFNYQAGRDQVEDGRYDQLYADSRGDVDYDRALAKAKTLAEIGDFSGYAALGYTQEEIDRLKASYDAANGLVSAVGGLPLSATAGEGAGGGGTGGTAEGVPPGMGADSGYQQKKGNGVGRKSRSSGTSGGTKTASAAGATPSGRSTGTGAAATARSTGAGAAAASTGAGTATAPRAQEAGTLELGIGPISDQTLRELLAQGKVAADTLPDGTLYYHWTNGYSAENYKISPGNWLGRMSAGK